jgi:hypothetical protein
MSETYTELTEEQKALEETIDNYVNDTTNQATEVADDNEEFILDYNELKGINAAVTAIKVPIRLCTAEQGVVPKSPFNLALQINGLRVPTFGTYAELKLINTAKNLGDTPEELRASVGKRVFAVHCTVYGHHILSGEDPGSGEEFTFEPERQELLTLRLGLSMDRRSTNQNKWSVATIFDDNPLFWETVEGQGKSAKVNAKLSNLNAKQFNAQTQFAKFIKDLFEGLDLSRLEEGGDLNHLPDKFKQGYRKYVADIEAIYEKIPQWDSSKSMDKVKDGAAVGAVTATVTQGAVTNMEDLAGI